ncbi:type I CRISPR-associated protein Cas7 [bacterium]|nr:type I CRISPR-associated protein Cas7 [bacterium]
MPQEFKNRVYGAVIVKAINSNYNADFTHQPRTLPNGVAYATDKALKYLIKNYIMKNYPAEKVLYFKSLDEDMKPRTLDESYKILFGEYEKSKKGKGDDLNKSKILANLLKCLDIRLFGATFAAETNISIHGPVQICHGVNRYPENIIFSEQIMSPFRNPSEKSKEAEMTTLGSQSKLKEGHYVHHFSINPKNLAHHRDIVKKEGNDAAYLTTDDITKLKEAMRSGVTFYDSASKAGTENELLFWVQLKDTSKLVLPNFTERVMATRNADMVEIDLNGVSQVLADHSGEIEAIELHYNATTTAIKNQPKTATTYKL